MKTRVFLLLLAWVIGSLAATGWSQPDPGAPPFEGDHPYVDPPLGAGPGPEFDGAPPFGGEPRDQMESRRSGQHLERWFEHMRRENPEEYERLMTLRREDPEAFRRALRERRDHLKQRGPGNPMRRGMPPGEVMVPDMSPGERRRGMGPSGNEWQRSRSRQPENQEIARLEREAKALVEQYHEASVDDQAAIRAKLRDQLGKLFEQREAQRRRQIERMASKLDSLENALEERAAQRDEIIDRRMGELLGEDSLAW